MTGTARSSAGLDARRRRALVRSWRRGIRETDLILGGFADASIHALTDAELCDYEALLEAQDAEILSWFTGACAVPDTFDTTVFRKILVSRIA